jgi:hypothetical protein
MEIGVELWILNMIYILYVCMGKIINIKFYVI